VSDIPVKSDGGAVTDPLDDIRSTLRKLTGQVTQLDSPAMGLEPPGRPVGPSSAAEPPPTAGTVHQIGMGQPGLVADDSALLRDVLVELRQLRVEVQAMRAVPPAKNPPLLLSRRRAAKLLGIDRDETLGELLSTGNIRTVTVGGRTRIPLAEVQRLAAEGTTRTGRKPHRRSRPAAGQDEVAKILALRRPT
jgi:excisionase family DNA binding protein